LVGTKEKNDDEQHAQRNGLLVVSPCALARPHQKKMTTTNNAIVILFAIKRRR
jgi:hypothetical protein